MIIKAWKAYEDKGIMIEIDFSLLNLKNMPQVNTSLYGNSHHWDTTGAKDLYLLTNKKFRVYIKSRDFNATVFTAKVYQWKLVIFK